MDSSSPDTSNKDQNEDATAAALNARDYLVAKLQEILRFLAQKAFECMRWFFSLFNATTVLVTCTHYNYDFLFCCCCSFVAGIAL